MKKIIVLVALLLGVLCFMSSCSSSTVVHKSAKTTTKPLPPGQAKKVTGSQSAKEFAPGQQKKQPAKSTSKSASKSSSGKK